MICIYTSEVSPRVSYTFKIIFEEILGITFQLTSSLNEFNNSEKIKIAYDANLESEALRICPSGLLIENDIREQKIEVVLHAGIQGLFPVKKGVFSFDPFSAAFYLLTRYEELDRSDFDRHGRFKAENSIAFKNGFLETPVVNQYAELVRNAILEKYPDCVFNKRETNVVPTIDIDNAFAYKNKGLVFHFGSLIKKLLRLKLETFKEHLGTLLNGDKDPYNSYATQFDIHKRLGLKAVYFFLVGEKGTYDRNLSLMNLSFQNLIKRVAENSEVGIHPSYNSNSVAGIVQKEKQNLEKVLGDKVYSSRQHYLMMDLPETYLTLEKVGVTDDYTMGYASQIGFRAGICTPYTFYFLREERESKLTVHPFCVMDSTLKYYLKISNNKVLAKVKPLFDEVKKVNGEINVLFHNESIGAKHHWRNWDDLYEQILKEALND